MLRRSSVVHVVDELARAQRRERQRDELEALLVGRGVGAVGRARRAGPGARARGRAARGRGRLGDVGGWVAVGVGRRGGAGDRGRLGGSCCGCCGRCACGGRGRGRRSTRASRPVRSGARACGRSRACPRATCSTFACGVGSRSPISSSAASTWRRACGRGRCGWCAIGGTRRGRACWSCGAIRSRARRRCRGRLADAEALSLWEPIPVGVDEQGERGGDRAGRAQRADRRRAGGGQVGGAVGACSPRRRSIRTRGSGCSTASSSSSPRGRRSRSGSPARTARRRSSCCARSARRWTSATASCSRAGCARSAARTGCRCTWWSATSWRST